MEEEIKEGIGGGERERECGREGRGESWKENEGGRRERKGEMEGGEEEEIEVRKVSDGK